MLRYYFPIIHNDQIQADDVGELFGSAELAVEYGAFIARDIASDPDCDRDAGTVVIVVDTSGAEIARHVVGAARAVEVRGRQGVPPTRQAQPAPIDSAAWGGDAAGK
ncbi:MULTISPECIES: hypothetical protein [unclassified Bradyrhizobium]|uniref:DUF6894 family protein n=1 Tax=unclassified Bradyrhizobium TaxID=2631580 RepID=UPI001FFBF800|nr:MULTISPECIES: hypothetical protein [unclassified Bradyrhizobium]